MRTIDIILPVYSEQAGIRAFDEQLRSALAPLERAYQFNIIYVLDRSPDRSFEILKEIATTRAGTTLIHLSARFGHQSSILAGLDHSTGDAAIMMDSDLQHPPALIPELLRHFEEGCDVVQTIRQYGPDTPRAKRATSRLFYLLQNALSPVQVQDGSADFRLISRKVVLVFQRQLREHGTFLRLLIAWAGFRTAYVNFVAAPRQYGVTQYSTRRLFTFLIDGLIAFSRLPLRVAAVVGGLIGSAGLIYGLFLVYNFLIHQDFPRGYSSLMSVMLVLGGMQLFMLGVLGEYIGHIFEEVKSRPLYIVDEIINRGI